MPGEGGRVDLLYFFTLNCWFLKVHQSINQYLMHGNVTEELHRANIGEVLINVAAGLTPQVEVPNCQQ
jgi:hypothetical protein